MNHKKSVEEMYGAFGRGDIPFILNRLAENVEWEYAYRITPSPVPWPQPREGRQGVAKFFESLGAVEFHKFMPKVLLAEANIVAGLLDLEVTVKATGKRIVETDETHIWHFNCKHAVES